MQRIHACRIMEGFRGYLVIVFLFQRGADTLRADTTDRWVCVRGCSAFSPLACDWWKRLWESFALTFSSVPSCRYSGSGSSGAASMRKVRGKTVQRGLALYFLTCFIMMGFFKQRCLQYTDSDSGTILMKRQLHQQSPSNRISLLHGDRLCLNRWTYSQTGAGEISEIKSI